MAQCNSRAVCRLFIAIHIGFVFTMSLPVLAQKTERTIRWEEIVKLVDSHPSAAAGRYAVEAAAFARDAKKAAPNPNLEGEAAYARSKDGSETGAEWSVGLSMPLSWIAGRKAKGSQGDAEILVAKAESSAVRRELLSALQTMFWDLVSGQAKTKALLEIEAETESLLGVVRKQAEKGEVRPTSAVRVEIEVEKIAAEVEIARASLDSKQAALALVLGMKETTLVADADLNAVPTVPTLDAVSAQALQTHPSIATASAKVRSLEAAVKVERVGRVPEISVRGFASSETDKYAFGGGAAMDLPLWNWNNAPVAEAEARLAQGRSEEAAALRTVTSEVAEAFTACKSSVKIAERLKERMVPLAENAASDIDKAYRLGESSLLDLIDARRNLLDARLLLLDALSRARTDCNRLSNLKGDELP